MVAFRSFSQDGTRIQEIDLTDIARLVSARHLFRYDEIVCYSNWFENGDQKGAKLIAR